MITGIIIGILVWQAIIFILLLTDKLDSDAGSLFASGIFGLIGICLAVICRFIHRNTVIRKFNKNFVKGLLWDNGHVFDSFYIPKKEIDFFCTDNTKKYYVEICAANLKNGYIEKSYVLTVEKAKSSLYLKKFLKTS